MELLNKAEAFIKDTLTETKSLYQDHRSTMIVHDVFIVVVLALVKFIVIPIAGYVLGFIL